MARRAARLIPQRWGGCRVGGIVIVAVIAMAQLPLRIISAHRGRLLQHGQRPLHLPTHTNALGLATDSGSATPRAWILRPVFKPSDRATVEASVAHRSTAHKCARQESNLQPTDSKSATLSN